MQEKTIVSVALCCTILGLVGLYVVMDLTKYSETTITNLSKQDVGSVVKLKGIVRSISKSNNSATVYIEQECVLPVVVYRRLDVNLSRGQSIEVIGKYDESSKKQVIADEIRIT